MLWPIVWPYLLILYRLMLQNGNQFCSTHSCVCVEALKNFPTPVLVLLVLGEAVQVEEAFHSLWS